jgi:hypothetical protein
MEAVRKQKRTIGSIVEIPLHKGYHGYGRVLKSGMAFYDLKSKKEEELQFIISHAILFITGVSHHAITKGYWQKIGSLPLEEELLTFYPQYIQDPINQNSFRILLGNGIEKEATLKECLGLERFASWTPEGIEIRLNDYFFGTNSFGEKTIPFPEQYRILLSSI